MGRLCAIGCWPPSVQGAMMKETPTPESLRPGSVVGSWRIEGYAGRGSYGLVFRARRVGAPHSKPVALKMAAFAYDVRFLREGVWVERAGRAVLMDYGSCTWAGAPPLTETLMPPNTPEYRSPEALRFQWGNWRTQEARYEARPADDLYALGVSAYRLVTSVYPPLERSRRDSSSTWRRRQPGGCSRRSSKREECQSWRRSSSGCWRRSPKREDWHAMQSMQRRLRRHLEGLIWMFRSGIRNTRRTASRMFPPGSYRHPDQNVSLLGPHPSPHALSRRPPHAHSGPGSCLPQWSWRWRGSGGWAPCHASKCPRWCRAQALRQKRRTPETRGSVTAE
jgi:hypothetical protein